MVCLRSRIGFQYRLDSLPAQLRLRPQPTSPPVPQRRQAVLRKRATRRRRRRLWPCQLLHSFTGRPEPLAIACHFNLYSIFIWLALNITFTFMGLCPPNRFEVFIDVEYFNIRVFLECPPLVFQRLLASVEDGEMLGWRLLWALFRLLLSLASVTGR